MAGLPTVERPAVTTFPPRSSVEPRCERGAGCEFAGDPRPPRFVRGQPPPLVLRMRAFKKEGGAFPRFRSLVTKCGRYPLRLPCHQVLFICMVAVVSKKAYDTRMLNIRHLANYGPMSERPFITQAGKSWGFTPAFHGALANRYAPAVLQPEPRPIPRTHEGLTRGQPHPAEGRHAPRGQACLRQGPRPNARKGLPTPPVHLGGRPRCHSSCLSSQRVEKKLVQKTES
jgi:hypothetical protein